MAQKNHYETTVIINGSLDESQINSAVERLTEFLTKHDAEVGEPDNWGRKRLAYPIAKKNNGHFVQVAYDAPSDIVAQLRRFISIDDAFLRELTLQLSETDLAKRERTREMLARAAAEAEAAREEEEDSEDDDDDED